MADPADVVRQFIAAWSRLDVEELLGWFTEDGIYHNMPIAPVQGHTALRPFITAFAGGWASTQWDVANLAASGNVVFAERVDRTVTKDGKQVDLPCCGVFEVRDGRIAAWRDYFDMTAYTSALA